MTARGDGDHEPTATRSTFKNNHDQTVEALPSAARGGVESWARQESVTDLGPQKNRRSALPESTTPTPLQSPSRVESSELLLVMDSRSNKAAASSWVKGRDPRAQIRELFGIGGVEP